jgi:hypothetical protein
MAARGPASPPPTDAERQVYGILEKDFARMFLSEGEAHDAVFEVAFENLRFIGFPVTVPPHPNGTLTAFNIFVVLPSRVAPTRMYRVIVEELVKAVEHEEKRCGYLTQQVLDMGQIREEFLAQGVDPTEQIQRRCELAGLFRKLALGLNQEGEVELLLNEWIKLSFSLEDPTLHPQQPLRPYHTLLLLDNKRQELLQSLPADCSPTLRQLVNRTNPYESFSDTAVHLGVPLSQLYRMATHLVYWKKAKIADTFNNVTIFAPSPHAVKQLAREQTLTADMRESIRGFLLKNMTSLKCTVEDIDAELECHTAQSVLQRFYVRRPLRELTDSLPTTLQRQTLYTALVYLLQRDLVVQLRTFLYFIGSDHDRTVALEARARSKGTEAAARKAALELADLLPYCNGEYSLADIQHRLVVNRDAIEAVIDASKGLIITCTHE